MATPHVTWAEFLRTFLRIGMNSFGGPAGQIGVMHRVLVEERGWVSDRRFAHALNFCMLLPGPEATQMMIYVGWLMKRTWGGVAAGTLFVLPGALCMLALSVAAVEFQSVAWVGWALFGLRACAVALVVEAIVRISRRVLKSTLARVMAVAALVASQVQVPFAVVVLVGAVVGALLFERAVRGAGNDADGDVDDDGRVPARSLLKTAGVFGAWLAVWMVPLCGVWAVCGWEHTYTRLGVMNSKATSLSFGGAYAAIAFAAQQGVEVYKWLTPGEMATALSLAESTPGPLVLVLQHIGYVAGRGVGVGAGGGVIGGVIGSVIALWGVFVPCALWVFVGAPYMEALRARRGLACALSGISACVVGAVMHIALVLVFSSVFERTIGVDVGIGRLTLPVLSSVQPGAAVIAGIAGVLLLKYKIGVGRVVVVSAVLGVVWRGVM